MVHIDERYLEKLGELLRRLLRKTRDVQEQISAKNAMSCVTLRNKLQSDHVADKWSWQLGT